MRSDAQLAFVPIGGNLSLVGGLGAIIPSNVIDLLGQGLGTPPGNIIGNRALFGMDVGIGTFRPEIAAVLGAAAASGGAATLNVALQAAPDTGVGGGYLPGAWSTLAETGFQPLANLFAGAKIARFPFLPSMPENLNPRYLRLAFSSAVAALTAGSVAYALVTLCRDDMAQKGAAKNYTAQ